MTTLLASLLPLAGCAAMMLLCARMMRRGDCTTTTTAEPAEVTQLRAEVAQLRARLEPTAQPDEDQLPVR
ncbi:MAG: hypothetical protein ACRD29_01195 [Acidimicrobiales bacterium]